MSDQPSITCPKCRQTEKQPATARMKLPVWFTFGWENSPRGAHGQCWVRHSAAEPPKATDWVAPELKPANLWGRMSVFYANYPDMFARAVYVAKMNLPD